MMLKNNEISHYAIAFSTTDAGELHYRFWNQEATAVTNTIDKNRVSSLGLDPLAFPLTQTDIDTYLKPKAMELILLFNEKLEIFPNSRASAADYLREFTKEQRIAFLKKGLDLNKLSLNGVAPFTFAIGNAENDWVNNVLDDAKQFQRLEQRTLWLNKPDELMRDYNETLQKPVYVGQTALQLTIAKGYVDLTGNGFPLSVSNFTLAQKLLDLGANQCIDYAEPSNGNTALHFAYMRRDINAILLLEAFNASRTIQNFSGKTPADMLALSFAQVNELLKFHTSPDGHSDTFVLKKSLFSNQEILSVIQNYAKSIAFDVPVNSSSSKMLSSQTNKTQRIPTQNSDVLSLPKKLTWAASLVKRITS